MLSRFFVRRPIFAWVIAIVIMLAGALSIYNLPVAQYPVIAPPQVVIEAQYPGASAETMSRTVTQVIEQELTGLDGLLYLSSTSDATGRVSITCTFEAGTNADIAQVQVQNKLSKAETTLPETVKRLGVTTEKSAASFLMVVGFVDERGKMSSAELGDYLTNNIKEPVARLEGVGQVTVFGASFSMRIWLDPAKLYKYGLQPSDVAYAIREQNVQVASGDIGAPPSGRHHMISATVKATDMLQTPEQFDRIAVKTMPDGTNVRVRDIGYSELGQQTYIFEARMNGKPSTGMAIRMAAGANAIQTANRVKDCVEGLQPYFPEGMTPVYPFETTPFIIAAMKEVVKTLIEAIVLVVLIMYLFLQNFRATLIPTIAVPVVLLGTFAVLNAFGYSINMLSMFGLVLAIGLLVDDAIVVVENVERVMQEDKCDAPTATVKSMNQITGALIGVAMTLSAVFIPMAFFGGSTGVIYRQFSVTIVSAMVLSVVVALTLTPALCASMLKPVHANHDPLKKGGFFGAFNRGFVTLTNGVRASVAHAIRRVALLLLVYAALIGCVVYGFMRLPTGFVPPEDQGSLIYMAQTPPAASAERTDDYLKRLQQVLTRQEMQQGKDDVESVFSVRGFSFAGTGVNNAMGFLKLKHWDERKRPDQSSGAIMMRSMGTLFSPHFKDAMGFVFPLPAIPELGVAEGFDFYLQDRSGQGHEKLYAVMNQFLQMARKDPRLVQVRHSGMEDMPQIQIDIDYEKARSLGLSHSDINTTLNIALGSNYINDFMDRGRIKKVFIQGHDESRGQIEDIYKWHVRNKTGQLVPFSSFAKTHWTYGPARIERFNSLAAVNIQGSPAPGVSSGQAMQIVKEIAQQLPPGYSIEWNAVSYQEQKAGQNSAPLYALSILVVFLALAALYESWTIPIAVLLVLPLGILGSLAMTWLVGKNNDIYFQVGLLTTVGLVSKNAILIVEFARDLYEGGMDALAAVIEAVRLRLRPILMTSLAFGLGVLPMAMAHGAGAGAQSAIGFSVLGGMITGTFLCVFFVPVFYALIVQMFGRKNPSGTSVQ